MSPRETSISSVERQRHRVAGGGLVEVAVGVTMRATARLAGAGDDHLVAGRDVPGGDGAGIAAEVEVRAG
jgi:hypothetical protein